MVTRHPARLAAVPALALAALLGGCVKNTVSIQATSICAIPDECKFSAKCDAQIIYNPELDVTGGAPMWLPVEMHNNMPADQDLKIGQLNNNDAHFESYTLDFGGLLPGIDPAMVTDIAASGGRAQQFIPANGTSVIGFEPIPLGVVNALAGGVPAWPDYDEVLVTVTFKGRLESGDKWEVPFKVPVRLWSNAPRICKDPTQAAVDACPSMYQNPRGALVCL